MTLFVDTSVWSQALRRDAPPDIPEVDRLRDALSDGEPIQSTGIVLQELLQGYRGPTARSQIIERFAAIDMIAPTVADHVAAASLRNECRRHGVQVGTVDALLAQLCIDRRLMMLTSDLDFGRIAHHAALRVWRAP